MQWLWDVAKSKTVAVASSLSDQISAGLAAAAAEIAAFDAEASRAARAEQLASASAADVRAGYEGLVAELLAREEAALVTAAAAKLEAAGAAAAAVCAHSGATGGDAGACTRDAAGERAASVGALMSCVLMCRAHTVFVFICASPIVVRRLTPSRRGP